MKTFLVWTAMLLVGSLGVRAEEPYPSFPAGVLAAYLNEDASGAGWSSETFPNLIRYAVWPEAPGWDTITVIDSFAIGEAKIKGNKASVPVRYHVLGRMENDTFKSAPGVEDVTYELEREQGRWKVAEPQLMPHIAVADVLRISRQNKEPGVGLKTSLKALQKLAN